MDIIQQLGTALGLGLLSGVRLYLTVLGLGAAIRLHWIALDASQSGLSIVSDWRVMTIAGVACAIEFIADKVPWVDSMWDSVHTFIRPIGAAILGARAFMHTDPAIQVILAILCGGLALSGHSAKAATRLAVNHSPEPFSNIALSLAGDAAVPLATWTAFNFPTLTFGFVLIFMVAFSWLAPKIFRAIRLELAALGAAFGRWFGGSDTGDAPRMGAAGSSLPAEFAGAMRPLPDNVLADLRAKAGAPQLDMGVRCAATKSIGALNQSLGYLCVVGNDLVFVTRRLLRGKLWSTPLASVSESSWTRGIFFDKFYVTTADGEVKFDILKAAPRTSSTVSMATSTGS